MPDITLNENQAALLLEEDEDGEISVKVIQSSLTDQLNLPAEMCQVMARKLIEDERFRDIVIAGLDE